MKIKRLILNNRCMLSNHHKKIQTWNNTLKADTVQLQLNNKKVN